MRIPHNTPVLFIPGIFFLLILTGCTFSTMEKKDPGYFYADSRPYTRWWWFASLIKEEDIRDNLDWLRENGFGGVEIAWVYPLNRMQGDTVNYTPRQEWLSEEWTEVVKYAKEYAGTIGLGCDFTFGSLWPFGDSEVPRDDGTCVFGEPEYRQEIRASWEYPVKGLVINHLDRNAFRRYAERMNTALGPAIRTGRPSALFVDSWEVETRQLWTPGFDLLFYNRYGYDIRPFMDSICQPGYEGQRYDYMSLLSDYVIDHFYRPFTENARNLGSFSRAQCAGAPADIISAYSTADVPESEAMLYEPDYSRIVASAALLSGKNTVTAETFTCLYGWPRDHLGNEQTADLKMVADALFANGVNHIIWHGKPFNPAGADSVRFYASVHAGPSGALAGEIRSFNAYLEKVSAAMKRGVTCSQVAVYLPTEDSRVAGDLPDSLKFPWAWGEYEMRYVYPPAELEGYHPLWINREFLEKARWKNGLLVTGDAAFGCLYLDVKYLDGLSLLRILQLAREGLPVCLKQVPEEPGYNKTEDYRQLIGELTGLKNVSTEFTKIYGHPPLLEGEYIPAYWCRMEKDRFILFFANPSSKKLKFPVAYGESFEEEDFSCTLAVNTGRRTDSLHLKFEPYQSVLLEIPKKGKIIEHNIHFIPKTPEMIEGKGRGF